MDPDGATYAIYKMNNVLRPAMNVVGSLFASNDSRFIRPGYNNVTYVYIINVPLPRNCDICLKGDIIREMEPSPHQLRCVVGCFSEQNV